MDAPQVANAITKISKTKIKTKNGNFGVRPPGCEAALPLMTEEELYDRIPSEASQHIPFDIADRNQLPTAGGNGLADGCAVGGGKERQDSESAKTVAQAERRRWL